MRTAEGICEGDEWGERWGTGEGTGGEHVRGTGGGGQVRGQVRETGEEDRWGGRQVRGIGEGDK